MSSRARARRSAFLRTGNTLRRHFDPQLANQNATNGTIEMDVTYERLPQNRHENIFNVQEQDEDNFRIGNNPFCARVQYSLNKNRMWDFEEWIKDNYTELGLQKSHLVLGKHHLLNRAATCTEIFTNDKHMTPGATQEQPVSRRGKGKRSHLNFTSLRRNYDDKREQEGEESDNIPLLEIDIYRGVSPKSDVTYNPKMLHVDYKCHECSKRQYRAHNKKKVCQTKNWRTKRRREPFRQLNYEDDFCEEMEECFSAAVKTEVTDFHEKDEGFFDDANVEGTSSMSVNLMDYLVTNKHQRSRKRKHSDYSTDDEAVKFCERRKIYIDTEDQEETQEADEERMVSVEQELQLVTFPSVNINAKSLPVNELSNMFGMNYMMSDTVPRKHVFELHGEKAYIIMEELNNTDTRILLDASLNSTHHSEEESRQMLADMKLGLESSSDWCCLQKWVQFKEDLVEDQNTSFVIDEQVRERILHDSSEVKLSRPNTSSAVENTSDEFGECDICLEVWISCTSDHLNRGTTLSSCKHTFCNTCWQRHLLSTARASMTQTHLHCPAHGCTQQVDKAALISFLPARIYQQHETILVNSVLRSGSSIYHNCKCGRFLRLPSTKRTVECVCGDSVCAGCRQEPHWPVRCKPAANYILKLRQLGHENLAAKIKPDEITVMGKNCPKCRQFIEKSVGCNHMVCVCGQEFCWWCLRNYSSHKFGPCNQYRKDNNSFIELTDVHFTSRHSLLQPNSQMSKNYCEAVELRAQRHDLLQEWMTGTHRLEVVRALRQTAGRRFSWEAHKMAEERLNVYLSTLNQLSITVEYCMSTVDRKDRHRNRTVKNNVNLIIYIISRIKDILQEINTRSRTQAAALKKEIDMLIDISRDICNFLASVV